MPRVEIKCLGADTKELDELLILQGNLKKLSKRNLEKLKAAILKHGFIAPIFLWPDGERFYILDGTQRIRTLLVLREEGYLIPPLPVDFIQADNIDDAKLKLLHITSQYGEFDRHGLDEFILSADLDISELETIRLTNTEFRITQPGIPETEGDDDLPETVEAITKLGDLWQLGRHKLLCGDSQAAETFSKLLGVQKADLLVADPPYNVDYAGKIKTSLKIKNDKIQDQEYQELLTKVFANCSHNLKAGGAVYIWLADIKVNCIMPACIQSGFIISQWLIWSKQQMVLGRKDYQQKHEPCLYGWKQGASHRWYADRKQTTVLNFERPSRSKDHPTMKPVDLLAYLIGNSSKEEDIVLDAFLGSGSTLIACEKMNRLCFGVELDPHYCDVVVARYVDWRKQNGREVRLRLNGRTVKTDAAGGFPDLQGDNRSAEGGGSHGKKTGKHQVAARAVGQSERPPQEGAVPDVDSRQTGRRKGC